MIHAFLTGRRPPGLLAIFVLISSGCGSAPRPPNRVGIGPDGRAVLPVNQVIVPAGIQVELPGLRPQAVALSPDGRLLVTSGKTSELVVIDPETGKVLERVPLPSEKSTEPVIGPVSTHILDPDKDAQLSFTGLEFSPDGSRLYLSNVNGSIKVFGVDGGRVRGLFTIALPPAGAPRRGAEIPSGLAVSPDGRLLYVALNLSNQLGEIDARSGKVLRLFGVGVAPYDVALAGRKAYVSNWGGRRAEPWDVTGPAGQGTRVRVDPVRHIASEGSVSIVDLESGKVLGEVPVGLHASGLAVTPDGAHLFVANAGSDTVSVLDTAADRVIDTIPLSFRPGDLFGASPNALALDASGELLFVANGSQNAVAVVSCRPGAASLLGFIPVGWFPGALAYDAARHSIHVANIKGVGSGKKPGEDGGKGSNSHQHFGTLSIVRLPGAQKLSEMTIEVLENCRRMAVEAALLPPRPDQPPRPVPERSGEPSLFKHVVYIIKENRTYDQVLGDMPEGAGDPKLCIFGEEATPNQHRIAREFMLLDNAYCSGVLSADGHQWATTGFATDYMEKSFAGFPRSYPDGMEDDDVDALAYAPSGFLWDSALARGKTVRDYGEFAIAELEWTDPRKPGKPGFMDIYRDFTGRTGLVKIWSRPAIESLREHLVTDTVGWTMNVPDVFRARKFIDDLERFEKSGAFPDLTIICLPNNHTSGTQAGMPTPAAHVADNDLAFGQIIEALSRSRFWKETCVLAIEDDPQDGWDHLSAYRTTAFVASPYSRGRGVISTQYNQTGILRTIELILGLPPMNQLVASATPLADCFGDTIDLTPYTALPNRIPLDRLNPDPKKIADPILKADAIASASLPLEAADRCPEDVLNRIIWRALKGSSVPYPEWAIREHAGDDDD